MKVSFPKKRTPTSDMFYLYLEELQNEVMIYIDQEKATEGKIYVYPIQPEDTNTLRFFRIQPYFEDTPEVFYAWFSYFYLNSDEEPPQEILTKYLEMVSQELPNNEEE